MKKITVIFMCVLILAVPSGFRADAATGNGALTASDSAQAFVAAMERFLNSIRISAPWDEFSEDDVIPLDPVAQFDILFRPLFNLGMSKDSMEREKNSFGWRSVTYEEQGNEFRIVCEYMGNGRQIYEGRYNPESDRLICKVARGDNEGGRIWDDIEIEYLKTDFGYVARVYDILRKVVHKLAVKGDEGAVSWGETKFNTLHPSIDYPKEGRAWYEISGNRFAIQPWDGPEREYKIKR